MRARELEVLPVVEYEETDIEPAASGSRPARRKKKAAKPQLQDKHGFQRPTAPVVREVMEGALKLDVPLDVDIKVGTDWESMSPLERA